MNIQEVLKHNGKIYFNNRLILFCKLAINIFTVIMTIKELYFIAIVPENEVLQQVEAIKIDIKNKFGAKNALKSPAHITLFPPFRVNNEIIKRVSQEISNALNSFAPFKIDLLNYSKFDNRVVYVDVVENSTLTELGATIITVMNNIINKQQLEFKPHITLATRDIPPQQFSTLWHQLKQKEYSNSFTAKAITIFKHNGKLWESFERIPLTPVFK